MPRVRNAGTGVVVSCSEETAARLGHEWEPVETPTPEPEEQPARKPRKRSS